MADCGRVNLIIFKMDIPILVHNTIFSRFQEKLSQRTVAALLCLSRSTVRNIINRFKLIQSTESRRRGGCGRKILLSNRHQRKLLRPSARFPNYSGRPLQFEAGGQCAKVNTRSIRRYLQRLGRGARRPLKSPSWTPTQRLRYHNWCKERQSLTSDE